MDLKRLLKHLATPGRRLRQAFPPALLRDIGDAITASESRHRGELRFAVEAGLDVPALLKGETSRQRALEAFSRLRVWDTEHNCGVLIYVQLVDRKVEILADRGISSRVPEAVWRDICATMEAAFRQGDFRDGSLKALAAVTDLLATHFPPTGPRANELPDQPVIL